MCNFEPSISKVEKKKNSMKNIGFFREAYIESFDIVSFFSFKLIQNNQYFQNPTKNQILNLSPQSISLFISKTFLTQISRGHSICNVQQMSISNNKKKRPSAQTQNPSRVLLTCVYDTIVLEITNETVFARFSPFGTVTRILIFQRGEVTKFFIEFSDTESAIRAKRALDGTKLYEAICKMNIYYSNFSSVDLKHQTTQGVMLQYQTRKKENCEIFNEFQINVAKNGKIPIFNSYVLLASEDEGNFLENQTFSQEDEESVLKDLTKNQNIIAKELEKTIENDINSLLRSEKKKPLRENIDKKGPFFSQENTQHFLCFFIKESIENYKIYNLFSNFGNISYIKQTKNCVFLKYKSQQFVQIAKSYLQGHIFARNKLLFFNLGQPNQARPHQRQFSEIAYYDHSYDRFTTLKSMTINPPSQTLHVSSLKREFCNVEALRGQFERFGKVEKIEILTRCVDRNMALVKFASMEESFEAISEMHGKNFGGRRMQISFTKSKVL